MPRVKIEYIVSFSSEDPVSFVCFSIYIGDRFKCYLLTKSIPSFTYMAGELSQQPASMGREQEKVAMQQGRAILFCCTSTSQSSEGKLLKLHQ